MLTADARDRLVANIAGHLCNAQEFIQQRAVRNFTQVHTDFGRALTKALEEKAKEVSLYFTDEFVQKTRASL